MRFFAAVAATFAVGAIASGTADEVYTVQVTEYTTYCPIAASSSAAAAASTTVSNGVTYSISRPLITSTVTHCNTCSSSTPLIHPPYPSSSSVFVSSAVPSSIVSAPSAPSGAAATTGSATTPAAAPVFTGGASRVAGAGAGLAAVFALAAYLL